MFDHTRQLRTKYWESENGAIRKEPESALSRKRDRTSSRSRKISSFSLDGGFLGPDDSVYPLTIDPHVQNFEAVKLHDRDIEEVARRFDKDPSFNMPKCTDRCLSAVDHSCYVPYGPTKDFLLNLTERIVSADEERGLFRRRYVPCTSETTNEANFASHLQLPELDFDRFRVSLLSLTPYSFAKLGKC